MRPGLRVNGKTWSSTVEMHVNALSGGDLLSIEKRFPSPHMTA